MNAGPLVLVAISAVALLAVPRRWAPLPFIMTACYLSIAQAIQIGPFSFTAIRMLVAVGIVRVLLRRERLVGGLNGLDGLILAWGAWLIISGLFHQHPSDTFINRLGGAYNALGIYFLLRIFCTSIGDVVGLCRATAILLIPVAIEMLYEMRGSPSLFHVLEGRAQELYIRGGRIRAFGPFFHPILAGTVGAVCIPLMAGIWHHHRLVSLAGLVACLAMIVSSASSGPVMSALAALVGLGMWRFRCHMRAVRWGIVLVFVALAVAMNAPVYYLIARINVVDGSTGYHRALLIESAVTYFGDWWATGTDYTRHWAPSPGAVAEHTDITNQYIGMAVNGGVLLLALFIGFFYKGFSLVGTQLRSGIPRETQFHLWALGAALFAHAVTLLSISYFDQSFVFLYLTLGAIGSARGLEGVVPSVHEKAGPAPRIEPSPALSWRARAVGAAAANRAPGNLGMR
jgi:hypothetical protein